MLSNRDAAWLFGELLTLREQLAARVYGEDRNLTYMSATEFKQCIDFVELLVSETAQADADGETEASMSVPVTPAVS
jgi:hypothetical protein